MTDVTDKDFELISRFIEDNYGIKLGQEKKSLLVSRLNQVVDQMNLDFSDYVKSVLNDKSGKLVSTLVDKITTNHTYFMREPVHFKFFENQVIPFLANSIKDKDLRIWSAGCSSGEEPYTLSMIMYDYFGNQGMLWDKKILATDISEQMLNRAIQGIYPKDHVMTLPQNWILNYFKAVDKSNYEVVSKIKNEVIFRKFNLMEKQYPFRKRFHVIFCRNVMIYFSPDTVEWLINKFYELTEPGGYLFVGHSESLARYNTLYKYVMPAVYRKV